jgi:hypothetical protein
MGAHKKPDIEKPKPIGVSALREAAAEKPAPSYFH